MDAIELANFPRGSLSRRGGALITRRSVRQKRSARRPEDPGHLASLTHGNGNRPAPFIAPAIEKVKNSHAIDSILRRYCNFYQAGWRCGQLLVNHFKIRRPAAKVVMRTNDPAPIDCGPPPDQLFDDIKLQIEIAVASL